MYPGELLPNQLVQSTSEYHDRHSTRTLPENFFVIVVSVLTHIIHQHFCCNRRCLTQARRERLTVKAGLVRRSEA